MSIPHEINDVMPIANTPNTEVEQDVENVGDRQESSTIAIAHRTASTSNNFERTPRRRRSARAHHAGAAEVEEQCASEAAPA